MTDRVITRQAHIATEHIALRDTLGGEMPAIDIGRHCSDPYDCAFTGHCWQHIPKLSVFDLRGQGRPDPYALYRQGIIRIEDVPRGRLGGGQKLQVDGLLYQQNYIDHAAVRAFLDGLWYPLCFLDFETLYLMPVPLFDGTRPYQQVVFQYSLHIINRAGEAPRHIEYLAEPDEQPQQAVLDSLLVALPENACVLVYNRAFEASILRGLAERFPEHHARIEAIIHAIRDLMVPFQKKQIYLWQMNGSYSLKDVLPALVPELSYQHLAIANGEMAAAAYLQMLKTQDPAEIPELRTQLLQYCRLDTLGMVKILENMRELAVRSM